jgi:hypothetical protein
LDPEASDNHRVFANLAEMTGVERPFRLEGGALLDGHVLTPDSQHKRLFILINHGPDPAQAQVHLPGLPVPGKPGTATVTDLFAKEPVSATFEPDGLHFQIAIDGYDSTALLII